MSKKKVFIDGQSGTTGLQILERLRNHQHVEVIEIGQHDRKNDAVKARIMQDVDVSFLCLPDEAARHSAQLAKESGSRVIDASSAHRCSAGWVYGLPELGADQRSKIGDAQCVANPGCFATGAILLLKPLTAASALSPASTIHISGASGYSGGGRALIDDYESTASPSAYSVYGLTCSHKHIPEIQLWGGLESRPNFFPAVAPTKQGMLVMVPLDESQLKCGVEDGHGLLADYYRDEPFVRVQPANQSPDGKFLHIEGLQNTNFCDLYVYCSAEVGKLLLVAKLDNLGKGASGAAVQNMNAMLGLPEEMGVDV